MNAFVEKVFAAGVVGCGGAGFPTHVKLAKPADWFIVNAAECEPLLRTDRHVMLTHAEELVETTAAMAEHLGAGQAVIALKKTYVKEIARLEEAIRGQARGVRLHLLENFYPAGDEQMMVQRVTGNSVPPGGLPLEVGAVVSNAATVLAVHDAQNGIPLTHKYLTITGDIGRTLVVRVPVGTSVADCLRLGGWKGGGRVIMGGPLMGKVLAPGSEESTPVTKTTSGLVVVADGSPLAALSEISVPHTINRARSACIQCSQCTLMCPRYLLGHPLQPHRIMRSLAYAGDMDAVLDDEAVRQALICCECGVCELFACPMGLQPRRVNELFKARLAERGIRYQRDGNACSARDELDYRLIPSKRIAARAGVLTHYDREPEGVVGFVPDRLVIPLKQHIGAAALPVVRAGEDIPPGGLVAQCPPEKLGANVHCGVAGRVEEVGGEAITVAVRRGES